jgi:predicted acetyltransferase
MTKTTIRQVSGDEALDILHPLNTYAFSTSPPLREREDWESFVRERKEVTYYALFEDGRAVSTAAGSPMKQNVRGEIYPMTGLWAVVTHPDSRRKGYSKRVLARLLEALREAGFPLTCLYPFRESFYERLGYSTFPLPQVVKFEPPVLSPLLDTDLEGEIEVLESSDHFDRYLEFVRSVQARVHGMCVFDHVDREAVKRYPAWLALAKSNGETVGLMSYRLKGDRPTQFKMEVTRFYYHTSLGRYLLLQWIARHIDQANEVEMTLPAFELPETWLSDLQVKIESATLAPMGRILDVSAISGIPGGSGEFSARITDPFCPWNDGVWRFESRNGALQVSSADTPECELNITAISALIYGTHDPGDFTLRGWGNPSQETIQTMRLMFPAALPHLHEYF